MTVALRESVRHPKIYAFTIPKYEDTPWQGPRKGFGIIKIGQTDRNVDKRIYEALNGIEMPNAREYILLLSEAAIGDDGRVFTDHQVHRALTKAGVHRVAGEWFEATKEEVLAAIASIRTDVDLGHLQSKFSFEMRPEQLAAVEVTKDYFQRHASLEHPPQFLWNAKMRFGKTFTTYQLAKRLGWTRVLVLTYKPAVERAWREDLLRHSDFEGWRFKGKGDKKPDLDDQGPLVWFASFQDVLGTDETGQPKTKNLGMYGEIWDAVVIDEYHFGAWRDAARSLYMSSKDDGLEGDKTEERNLHSPDLDDDFARNLEDTLVIKSRNYLYLSGTPFRALTEGEFLEDQVFNWTYSDEQRAKAEWVEQPVNPYSALPQMNLMVYDMPDRLREVALNNQSEFSLTEFFRTERDKSKSTKPTFKHEIDVQKWLNLLRGQDLEGLWANVASNQKPPLPFEDLTLLAALQHSVWYLPSVDACLAMAGLLGEKRNVFFNDYKVIIAAGNNVGQGEAALPPVMEAIGGIPQNTKTITLTCGKLMTGVTVPAWAGIFMLRELKSPETYFQAAFRVQSPWVSKYSDPELGGELEIIHKEQCYVIDFSPNRALRQIVDYATKLQSELPSQRDNENAINEFMEFLPVLAFDGYGMNQLQASDVINYLTSGVSASMLARRWNSPELVKLDVASMERLLNNPALLASLEQIEMFRNITNDLSVMISTNKELAGKKMAREPLDREEKKKDDESKKRRENLKDRLRRFITRIPAFMYLTDTRERTVKDVITQVEPGLFQKVTGLTLKDFEQLLNVGVFNNAKMDDAVWKFRVFEEPSLSYTDERNREGIVGGWVLTRDEALARLIDAGVLHTDSALTNETGLVNASIGEDYGILLGSVRYPDPTSAAVAAGAPLNVSGWDYWFLPTPAGPKSLASLRVLSNR